MKFTSILPASCIATLVLGATVDVTVGPGLKYSPDSVTAARGDVVRFHFGSGHNVVSGKFSSPCQPDNVIYSGEPAEGDTFSVTVNGTDPIWIYCSVPQHCENGMAMVINAPSNQNIAAYKRAASSVSSSSTPNQVAGGILNAQTSGNSSSSSSSSSSSASRSATASATSMSRTSSSSSASSTSAAAQPSSSSSGASQTLIPSSSVFGAAFAALAVALGSAMQMW